MSREVAAFYHSKAALPTPRYGDIRVFAPGCFGRIRLCNKGNRRGALRMPRLRCVTIEMQGEKEDSLAVNRWTLPRRRPRRFRARFSRAALTVIGLLVFVCGGLCAPVVRADEAANEAARELAKKVVAQIDLNGKNISVGVRDDTKELTTDEIWEISKVFQNAFIPEGNRPRPASGPSVKILVTLTKTPSQRLLIAHFEKDGTTVVEIVGFGLLEASSNAELANPVRIESQVEFIQADPFLDFAVLKREGSFSSEVLILGIRSVVLVSQSDGQWQAKGSLDIPEIMPVSRDMQGRLVVTGDTFEAGAGETFCRGTISPEFKMNCDARAGKWSFTLGGDQTLQLNPIAATNRFHTAPMQYPSPRESFAEASGRIDTMDFRVTADSEGRTWIGFGSMGPETIDSAWGDEFAAINSCGGRAAFLAAGRGDFNAPDFLQAVGNLRQSTMEKSPVFNLPGPVMALWSEPPGLPARAVVHNLKTGLYEAHQITVSCGH